MKFLVPLALLVAAGVSADDKTGGDSKSGCLADYIVTNCLASETKKVRSHSSISRVPLGPIEHRGMMRTICANVPSLEQAEGCAAADWDCMCAAYEAIATYVSSCR